LEKLVLLNLFETRVLSRLYKVWDANQSSHICKVQEVKLSRLCKAWEVNRSSCLYKAMEVT
jgi:hypothetical protein